MELSLASVELSLASDRSMIRVSSRRGPTVPERESPNVPLSDLEPILEVPFRGEARRECEGAAIITLLGPLESAPGTGSAQPYLCPASIGAHSAMR